MVERRHIWRQWAAALCVALLAALFLQEADATQHALTEAAGHGQVSVGDGVFIHVHEDGVAHDDDALPHEGAAPHAHQCLCVHPANLPGILGLGLTHRSGVSVAFAGVQETNLVRRFYALERPPRSLKA